MLRFTFTHLELGQGVGVVAQAQGVEEAAWGGTRGARGARWKASQVLVLVEKRALLLPPSSGAAQLWVRDRLHLRLLRQPASYMAFAPPTRVQLVARGVDGPLARHAVRLSSACKQAGASGNGSTSRVSGAH